MHCCDKQKTCLCIYTSYFRSILPLKRVSPLPSYFLKNFKSQLAWISWLAQTYFTSFRSYNRLCSHSYRNSRFHRIPKIYLRFSVPPKWGISNYSETKDPAVLVASDYLQDPRILKSCVSREGRVTCYDSSSNFKWRFKRSSLVKVSLRDKREAEPESGNLVIRGSQERNIFLLRAPFFSPFPPSRYFIQWRNRHSDICRFRKKKIVRLYL